MTEHSEPRRWLLAATATPGREDRLLRPGVDSTFNDEQALWAREDKACEADVEAVAQLLAEIAPPGDMFTRRAWCRTKARSLLSTIFKEGGEGS